MALAPGTTTAEVFSVDGVVLNTYAKNIESLTGRLRTPPKRTSNVLVPGRHGTVRTKGKKYDQNLLALSMWVIGCTDLGKVPNGSTARREFFARVNELVELLSGNGDTPLDIRHTQPDGSIRQCFGDVLDVLDFTTSGADPLGKVAVSITVHGAFWQDLVAVTTGPLVANVAALNLPQFAGASAPMEELTATIVGPWNNPKITFADGSWVQYNETLTAGQGVTIDASNWTLSGVGGYVPALSKLASSTSSSHWFALPPTGAAIPAVTLTAGGAERTAATALTIAGRRKYLVG